MLLSNDNKYLAVCTFNNKIELINFDTVTKNKYLIALAV